MRERTLDLSLGSLTRVLFGGLALFVLISLRDIVGLVLLAVVLATAIAPLLRWCDRQGIPRVLSVLSLLLAATAVGALLAAAIVPPLVHQVGQLDQGLPKLLHQTRLVLSALGITVPVTFGEGLSGSVDALRQAVQAFGGALLSGLRTATVFAGSVVLVLVLTVYFSLARNGFRGMLETFLPVRSWPFLATLERRIQDRLGRWFRGQLFVSVLTGVVSYLGFTLLHVPYAVLLAVLGALTMFIPVASAFLAGVPTVLAAGSVSAGTAVAATVFLVALHQVIANLVVPKVIGDAVSLNPLVVVLVMLTGAALAGVVGLLLAVPLAAATAVAVDLLRRT